MDVAEEGVEVEKEDGEVGVESRLKKPKGILQASPGMPPSTYIFFCLHIYILFIYLFLFLFFYINFCVAKT